MGAQSEHGSRDGRPNYGATYRELIVLRFGCLLNSEEKVKLMRCRDKEHGLG